MSRSPGPGIVDELGEAGALESFSGHDVDEHPDGAGFDEPDSLAGERCWKMVGNANELTFNEALARAAAMRAMIRGGPSNRSLFEALAETVFERYANVWKPRTLEVNRTYLRRQLLPWFAGREVADIGEPEVRHWFASLRATPVAPYRSAPLRCSRSS